jgi:exosome complex exonuclease DIS3/RRP44
MAQYAGRASAGFHTLLYFRGRDVDEDAYIIKVRENGVVVLVPRYGIEGVVFVCGPHDRSPFEYDQKREALQAAGCRLAAFDKVRIRKERKNEE